MVEAQNGCTAPRRALLLNGGGLLQWALRILLDRIGITEMHAVTAAHDVQAALERDPGIALLLVYAGPGGRSVLDDPQPILRLRQEFPKLRVVMVGDGLDRRSILRALDLGLHGVLPAFLDMDESAGALRAVMDGGIYVPTILAEIPGIPHHAATEAAPGAPLILTPRQREVLRVLVEGKSNKEIARCLQLSESTVKIHLAALFRTLHVTSRAGAAVVGSQILSNAPDV